MGIFDRWEQYKKGKITYRQFIYSDKLLKDLEEYKQKAKGLKMESNEIKDETYFESQEFKKYLEELKELGKEGFKVGDGVLLTDKCLNNIKHSFETSGIDLKSINFPFIGKMIISNIIEPNENDCVGYVEVSCEEKELTFRFRQDDAKESFLELIFREGIEPPKNIEVIK